MKTLAFELIFGARAWSALRVLAAAVALHEAGKALQEQRAGAVHWMAASAELERATEMFVREGGVR